MKTVDLKTLFHEYKVLTLSKVSQIIESSIRTVQRKFSELGVFRSFNKNGQYYTIPGIPRFNKYGIWSYESVYFSRWGNLPKTVIQIITNSESGLSGNEIGEILNLSPQSFLHHFRDVKAIFREKHKGVYVYFSSNSAIFERQRDKRILLSDVFQIKNEIAIKILIEYIKQPEITVEDLSLKLCQKYGCDITPASIRHYLEIHELLKKTPDLKP